MKLPRLNRDVVLTRKGRSTFRGEPLGTLIYIARDGRWNVRRDGQKTAELWAPGWWRYLRKKDFK